jgi:hypothetical protein
MRLVFIPLSGRINTIFFFILQAIVIKFKNFSLHRSLGYLGLFIALGTVATLPAAGLFQVKKELSQGEGETAVSSMVGIMTTAFIFIGLVGSGYGYLKKPKIHKRLLLLATIVLLWPAWFRFRHYFPWVPRPDIWFCVVLADSLILFSWIADTLPYGKVHPVLFYGGLIKMAKHVFEVLLFDSEPWRLWAKSIYALFV